MANATPAKLKNTPQDVAKKRSKPHRVTGSLKQACDLMIWGGEDGVALAWDEAARRVGLRVRNMRLALEKPHVRQYLNQQRQVFCSQASAANISRAVKIRDDNSNKMASVAAMKFIEEVASERPANAPGRVSTPGIVIVVNTQRDARMIPDQGIIEVNPLEDNDMLPNEDSEREE